MADGVFHPGPGRFNVTQAHQQAATSRHVQQRKDPPASNSRGAYTHDNFSPARSPTRRPPTHPLSSMYGQNHQQGHIFMSGAHSSQRYGMQMGKTFPPSHQAQSQSHHRQQQEHNGFSNHQHNTSGSNFASGSSHLNPSQMRNGTPTQIYNGTSREQNEEWERQQDLYEQLQAQTGTHHFARAILPANKLSGSASLDLVKREGEREDRNRAVREVDTDQNSWTELDLSGLGLPAISLDLFNYNFLTKLYLNKNHLSHVPAAIGKMRGLTLLDLSANELREVPPEIGMLVKLETLLLFDNYIESLPAELGYLWQLKTLGIIGNRLDRELEAVQERGTAAFLADLQELADPPTPLDREWKHASGSGQKSSASEESFKVMSFNSLCEKAATRSLYGYTPAQFLAWDHRKKLILNECRERNAEILCLQEVEQDAYNEYFRPELAHDGYKGIFWPKARARTMSEKEARFVDGCATLWKDSKYVQLDKQTIDFANVAINRPDMKSEVDIFNRVMPKDNIALCIFLEDRVTGARVLVVNAHLHWDVQFKDVKVVQGAILMEQVNRLAETYAKWPPTPINSKRHFRHSGADSADDGADTALPEVDPGPSQSYPDAKSIPLLICIDANSTPDSGVYELFTEGTLPRDHPDLGSYRYGKFTTDGMKHDFTLRSAYDNSLSLPFTNYTAGFTGVIDYIFYSANAFEVKGVLGEVDPAYLKLVPGFPNVHFPSDHLAIEAEFVTKKRKGERRP